MSARGDALDETLEAEDGTPLRLTRLATGARAIALVVPGIFAHRGLPEHALLRERLAQRLDVATLDVRGHGDSGGAFSWGAREPGDVAHVVAQLRRRDARVVGVGFSFGGFHCTLAAGRAARAGQAPLFDALALVGTPAHLHVWQPQPFRRGLLRHLAPALRRRRRFTRLSAWPFPRPHDPQDIVGAIAGTPLLVAHGSDDWLVPPSHARLLHQRARTTKELALIPRGLHAEYMLGDAPEALLAVLLPFVARSV